MANPATMLTPFMVLAHAMETFRKIATALVIETIGVFACRLPRGRSFLNLRTDTLHQ
jgi:hypothetical protein